MPSSPYFKYLTTDTSVTNFFFTVDGKYGPDVSLNEFIRNVAELRGTKAMCHEGGCGACVVSVRAMMPPSNEIKTFAVNSVSESTSFWVVKRFDDNLN